MANKELLIADAEFIFAEKSLITYLIAISEICNEVQEILISVTTQALEDQQISARLKQFADQIACIAGKAENLAETLNGKSYLFIEEIDQKDQFIY
ncbi:hypothetical protein IW492_04870 [Enterococcus sp. BWB1-3]|uniref:hypothetical protein n=1 Tax=unclassified Enterococcus TaxID=2608891 RepID=UPI0019204414|nr:MULTISPECIES: hypothetical protein [unclassified Enterococcus]MBL1228565.1 hypothetical protein [Enterococcus sp. BWB1-3]MCB5950570.1 hypothetical protein [Enterococcus sp. BWT-B8]MCB5955895.1 hypothetical protein [Enterococcus sp. CWB-B31]